MATRVRMTPCRAPAQPTCPASCLRTSAGVRIAGISGDGGGEDCRGNSSGGGAGVMIAGISGDGGGEDCAD